MIMSIVDIIKLFDYILYEAWKGSSMAFRYKIDMLAAFKDAGYTTYRIRQENLLHDMTLQNFRDNKMVSWKVLDKICDLLNCQPGDIIEHIKDE